MGALHATRSLMILASDETMKDLTALQTSSCSVVPGQSQRVLWTSVNLSLVLIEQQVTVMYSVA